MTRFDGPLPLSESLDAVARRIRRVDLREIDRVRTIWRDGVDPVLAGRCRPEVVKDRVLIVTVPSNAFAARVAADRVAILALYDELGSGAPTAIRTVIATPDDPLRAPPNPSPGAD